MIATAIALATSLTACSSSDDAGDSDNAAPTTLDASAITLHPSEIDRTSTTVALVTTTPEPLDPDDEVAVRQAVANYHDAVAESFDPIDPESAALQAATTPAYFTSLSALLQSLLASEGTATSDYVADIVAVSALGEGVARVDLCEVDQTIIYNADGSAAGSAPSAEPKPSFVALRQNEAGDWLVDGGGRDGSDRRCP